MLPTEQEAKDAGAPKILPSQDVVRQAVKEKLKGTIKALDSCYIAVGFAGRDSEDKGILRWNFVVFGNPSPAFRSGMGCGTAYTDAEGNIAKGYRFYYDYATRERAWRVYKNFAESKEGGKKSESVQFIKQSAKDF